MQVFMVHRNVYCYYTSLFFGADRRELETSSVSDDNVIKYLKGRRKMRCNYNTSARGRTFCFALIK